MLEARDIGFAYPKTPPLYSHFNLKVSPGERVGLAAPSGFGKTTLCKILAGYERPSSGAILVDEEPLAQSGLCPVQMIWQHPELACDPRIRMAQTLAEAHSVCKNPAESPLPGSRHRPSDEQLWQVAENEQLLDQLGIRSEWLSRFPHELSGGELQRFCIARALAAHPRYLIADEITTMLDVVTQAHIWNVLIRAVDEVGIGLVFVSHSAALTSRIATRVVNLAS